MPGFALRLQSLACAVLFGAAVQSGAVAAELSPQVWLNPGMYSQHFKRESGYRANNSGIGVEVLVTDDHALMAGSFINSDRRRSRYGLYEWRPLHWQVAPGLRLSAGVAAGIFDGYPRYRDGAAFAAALPLLALEGERLGVNLAIVPTIRNRLSGAVALQVKLRVW